MNGYLGRPGAPSDPSTPGPYCLARCYCGSCPQYGTQQHHAEVQRRAEYDARWRREHARKDRVR